MIRRCWMLIIKFIHLCSHIWVGPCHCHAWPLCCASRPHSVALQEVSSLVDCFSFSHRHIRLNNDHHKWLSWIMIIISIMMDEMITNNLQAGVIWMTVISIMISRTNMSIRSIVIIRIIILWRLVWSGRHTSHGCGSSPAKVLSLAKVLFWRHNLKSWSV